MTRSLKPTHALAQTGTRGLEERSGELMVRLNDLIAFPVSHKKAARYRDYLNCCKELIKNDQLAMIN